MAKDGEQKPETTTKNGETPLGKFDRRNLLVGLGGLYGAASLAANPLAFAAPATPDFKDCVNATEPNGTSINCCPPAASNITAYVPSAACVSRTRMSAQTFTTDSNYYRKYMKAIEKMKKLKSTDPRNFTEQANVHCAYCDGGYTQQGNPNLLYEIHGSWLFFPWHRWYLYFFEKICANLLDDDSFALPFWNWDDPTGMKIPNIFVNDPDKSPLYDSNRNPDHLPPTVINLDWSYGDPTVDDKQQIKSNLSLMYTQMITQSKTQTDFFGKAYRSGDDIVTLDGAGSIELSPHNVVHSWTGTMTDPNNPIDMGALYSAGRDPIFYAHHANVDRMWNIWLNQLGGTNFTDSDWLNSTFIFYNEEAKPVSVRVGDCLDNTKLGYTYEDVPIAWLDAKPTARAKARTLPSARDPAQVFPTTLEKAINVLVKRPKKSGSGSAEEILVIEGIEYDKDDVNASRPEYTEYLGNFSNVPHGHGMKVKTNRRFRITEVLKDLGVNNYESVLVTLVPKSGPLKINGVKIEFDSS
ncbi:Polyphenol oxidase [Forsythia ovata]|uniref:Polyphenol oxidase n=1 Tax=Forsythia ovata TaxID=205694 RepID=A0ABD1WJU9_9LAMI